MTQDLDGRDDSKRVGQAVSQGPGCSSPASWGTGPVILEQSHERTHQIHRTAPNLPSVP
jgi:hypothetical protein